MKLISNNVIDELNVTTRNVLVRVNIAWVRNETDLRDTLDKLSKKEIPIFLDYPRGRKKPPQIDIELDTVVSMIKEYPLVCYFAISNVEKPSDINKLRKKLDENVLLVPKIESVKGIKNIKEIVKVALTDVIMFDKEDLYSDVKQNNQEYLKYSKLLRDTCKEIDMGILELQGVVFTTYGRKE